MTKLWLEVTPRLGKKKHTAAAGKRRPPTAAAVSQVPKPRSKEPAATAAVRSRSRAWWKLAAWSIVALASVLLPSAIFYLMDKPTRLDLTLADMRTEASSSFAFGFSKADVSADIALQQDDALQLLWNRTDKGEVRVRYLLGPYTVQDMDTTAEFVAKVPPHTKLIQCAYSDTSNANDTGGGIREAPAQNASCRSIVGNEGTYVRTSVAPSLDSKGPFYFFLTFIWEEPATRSLGFAREGLRLRYQGRFPLESQPYTPADQAVLKYDTSTSGTRTGLPQGVYLEYVSDESERISDLSPEPADLKADTRIWVSTRDRPTYYLTMQVEQVEKRRVFELANQGILLIVGGWIGAVVPRVRPWWAKD